MPIATRFGPRLGSIIIWRPNASDKRIETPGLFVSTSRGVVPHLSRDHYAVTKAIRWVHIPFETFLEHKPPVPTLQPGQNPLHNFLGFSPTHHVLSMSIRDPHDGREMPPNGNGHISTYSLRGVRKVTPAEWRSYVFSCRPDVVVALSDTPFTNPPYSQKRLTRSLERSIAWLVDILRPIDTLGGDSGFQRLNVLVHMSGSTSIPARRAFSDSLTETLYGKEAEAIKPLSCLDEGISGYTFDLVPLRLSLGTLVSSSTSRPSRNTQPIPTDLVGASLKATQPTRPSLYTAQIASLLHASLCSLPSTKLRVVSSAQSPHEMLRLTLDIGVDLFDAHWAQRAANVGIALDFCFPVSAGTSKTATGSTRLRHGGKRDLGHDLYNTVYALDFSSLAGSFRGAAASSGGVVEGEARQVCLCAACSPVTPSTLIAHGCDEPIQTTGMQPEYRPACTRAYLHHLLHTHEMSAHSLLVVHNLSVLDAFFAGVREVLREDGIASFREQVEQFVQFYDEDLEVFDEARISWHVVELARGKGRLAREREKQD